MATTKKIRENVSFEEFFNIIVNRKISRKKRTVVLLIVILATFILRLSYIGVPKLDRTSWKEIDYIEISKNFTKNNYNILEPTITWPAEPPRVTAMEFPLVPYAASILYYIFGFSTLTVRILTLTAFLLTIVYVEKLTRIFLGQFISLLSALFVAFLPVFHNYGNFLYSEPTLIAFSVMTLYYFTLFHLTGKKRNLIRAIVFFAIALLLKPTSLYLSLPVLYIFIYFSGLKIRTVAKFITVTMISIIPAVFWYSYAYYLTKNSIDVFGIFEGHDKFQTLNMLSSSYWYFKMKQNLFYMLGGYFGVLLLLTGVIALLLTKKGLVFIAYLTAIASFFIIVAEGNIDGMYRHLTLTPPAAVMMATGTVVGAIFLSRIFKKKFRYSFAISITLIVLTFGAVNFNKLDKSNINVWQKYEWKIAEEIEKHIEKGDKIVTLGNYSIHKGGNDLSPVLYYYSGTTGWSLQKKDWDMTQFEELKNKGAKLIVCLHINREEGLRSFTRLIEKRYPKVFEDKASSALIFLLN